MSLVEVGAPVAGDDQFKKEVVLGVGGLGAGAIREKSFAAVSSCAWISTPTVSSHCCLEASSFSLRCRFCVRRFLASCLSCLRKGTRSVVCRLRAKGRLTKGDGRITGFVDEKRSAWSASARTRGERNMMMEGRAELHGVWLGSAKTIIGHSRILSGDLWYRCGTQIENYLCSVPVDLFTLLYSVCCAPRRLHCATLVAPPSSGPLQTIIQFPGQKLQNARPWTSHIPSWAAKQAVWRQTATYPLQGLRKA